MMWEEVEDGFPENDHHAAEEEEEEEDYYSYVNFDMLSFISRPKVLFVL